MGRGGYRPGAGRKLEGATPKRKVSVSISLEAAEALKNLEVMTGAKNQSQCVDFLLQHWFAAYDQMPPKDRPKIE